MIDHVPPLFRAAMCISLEDAGVDRPHVTKKGVVSEWPYLPESGSRIPLTDPDFVVQAVVEADLMVEILTGNLCRIGEPVLKLLGVDAGAVDVVYEKLRDAGHEFTPADLKDCLHTAGRMIGANGPKVQAQF